MNQRFVCVKVDREERPDVDAIYMDAVQAMTGHGGWPLNAFVTPEQVPFYAGTYFPPETRGGLPSWRMVLEAVVDAWERRREEIRAGSDRVVPRLGGAAARAYLHGFQVSGDPVLRRTCEETLDFLARELRGPEGGFASALDADSEGVEGRYYVWTLDQLRAELGDLADAAIAYFGATERGNFEGANVLEARGPEPVARDEIRRRLLAAREPRVRPG